MEDRQDPQQGRDGTLPRNAIRLRRYFRLEPENVTPFVLTVVFVSALSLSYAARQQASSDPASTLPVKLQPLFREGVQELKAGQLNHAAAHFREVLQQGGNTAFVHNDLGIVYQEQNEHLQAIAEFRQAIQIAPNYEGPHVLMGASLLALGRNSEAITVLERATSLAPEEPLARLELGKAYMRIDDPLKAVQQLQILRRIAPQNSEYAYQLGMAYLKVAEWAVTRIRQQNPESARLYQVMAESYRVRGEIDRAKAALEMAVRADPKLPGLHLEIATLDLQRGNTQNARVEVLRELAIVPESAAALELKHRLEAASQ